MKTARIEHQLLATLVSVLWAGHVDGQTTWSQSVLPGAPFPSDLSFTSSRNGQNQFDFTLGAGGSLVRMLASQDGNKEVIPYSTTQTTLTSYNTQWSIQGTVAYDDGNATTDDRFILNQAGSSNPWVAPVMQVEKNAQTLAVDVYSMALDQWNTNQQSAVKTRFSSLTRYEPQADGSVKVRRIIRFGDVAVNGQVWSLAAPFYESQNSFPVANFNALATSLSTSGSIQTYYTKANNIPQNQQTDVTQTNGYAVVYNTAGVSGGTAMGIVFGRQQMASPNQCVVNFSDDATAVSVRPGIRLNNVAPGAILDVTCYLVPNYGVNSSLASRLAALVAATPAPVLYPAGTAFTGELAMIVQRLNDNLALPGVRTDRLGYDVTPQPVTARPMLLSGPEDDADIRARLAIFPQRPESLLRNYLYGTDAEKQSANDYFFRYPGNGDGNGLRSEYISQMSRALMWDMYRYDIALGLGKATAAQKQQMLTLAEAKINAVFPYFRPSRGGGNLALEDDIALGLAGLNFPDHPNAQLWFSRSVSYTKQILDSYFPDGSGNESPRYQDWVLDLAGKYLHVLKRRAGLDLYDEPWLRSSLDWFIRYSSPPLAVTENKSVTPAWGDSTYSSTGNAHYYYDLSLFAQAYKDRDPDFASRLMYWWRKNGSPLQLFNAGSGSLTNSFLIDPRIPSTAQRPNTSTYSPWRGTAALHGGNGADDEIMATFQCGVNGGVHSDADMGTFDLFAFGVPLALDSTSGPYISGTTFNENNLAHNTVCFNGVSGGDTASGQFLGFGTSTVADYVSARTPYAPPGTVSNRHMVMVKPDYLVIWDENTTTYFADWYLHTPGTGTLEWQNHKVVSHTPWGVDLDVNVVLPSYNLTAPTYPGRILNTNDPGATANPLASAAADPGTAVAFTTQGQSRFGDGSTSRNPFPFQWQNYFSIRNTTSERNFLTVLHPRKAGVTPALTTQLVSSSGSGVKLQVTCNGRVDTVEITTSGATVTKGAEPAVQFAKTYPQSGVAGAAGYVKADFAFNPVTTLTNTLATTGPVEVHTGTLALGASERIPDTAPLHLMPGGTFDLGAYTETVGTLIADGGKLTGSGTLKPAAIEWWGGVLTAPVSASGNFVKKGGADWSRPATVSYTGDTVIESGNLVFQSGVPTLPGTGRVVLADGTGINLNGTSAAISSLDVTGHATLSNGSLAVTRALTGTGTLTNSGSLNLTGATTIAPTVSISTTGVLTLPAGAWSVKRLIIKGVIQPAGTVVSSASHPGLITGTGTITALEGLPVPTGLSATVSLGKITLAWSPVVGATSYSVRRALVSGGPYTEIGTPSAAGFADTSITDAVTYFYVVAARDATGDSPASAEISATARGPWYFDPNGAATGSVANGGAYSWVGSFWTKSPGGTASVEAWGPLRDAQFAATNPGTPLAYSVSLAGFSGAAHGFKSLRVASGSVTFTGVPSNFYFTQPPVISADSGVVLRFAQTGPLAFNLNKQTVTFDGEGTTLVSGDTVIINTGSIVKTGAGTLVLAAPNTYTGTTSIQGGVLRLSVTDQPTMWLDATRAASLMQSGGALSQWNDANGRGTFVSQNTPASRPTVITDATLSGPAKELVDFGPYAYYSSSTTSSTEAWMQFGTAMTDIRALFWVGKTSNDNFLLGATDTYQFHSGGPASTIWNATYAAANIRNGTTWLNGTAVPGTTTLMPATGLVRIGAFTAGNVSANAIARDRGFRYGGLQPGEIMVFNTVLTAQQQADIDAYLAKKWFNTGAGIGNRLPASTLVSLSNGGVLDLTGINFQTIAGLDASDGSGTRVDLGAAELTVSGAGSSSFDGSITGTGGLRKAGSGTFTLAGAGTYSGPTVVEAGTLTVGAPITSSLTVKNGATLVNNSTINGDLIIENGGIYLGSGTVTGAITTPPPVVSIISPTTDNIVMPMLDNTLDLAAAVVFNTAMGTPAITWTMVSGPGTVTFGNPSSTSTSARFSSAGTYTLRCTATATVNGKVLQGSSDRIVRPGGPAADSFTVTFREGENNYAHACALIRSDWTTGNAGVRDQIIVGTGFRSVFSFPLTGIPSNASVQSAKLDLWTYGAVSSLIGELELRHLTATPVEGTGNGSASTSGVGTGVSWNSRTGALDWTTAGGDYETGTTQWLSKVPAFSTAAAGDLVSFAASDNFTSAVQTSVAGGAPLDLIIISPTTTAANHYVRFVSDDNASVNQRPLLTVAYSTANPSVPSVDPGPVPKAMRLVAVALSGTAVNADGGTQWSLVSGPGTAIFGDASQPATTVTFSQNGTYVLRLAASNANGGTSRTITVVVTRNPGIFSDWQKIHWPGVTDPLIIGENANPDGDSYTNFLEFATNRNPRVANGSLTSITNTAAGLVFTYSRSKAAFGQGCLFDVEYSDNLADPWTSCGPGTVVSDNGTMQTVKATIPASLTGKRFVRLKVSLP